jgi:hypothetical protein
VWRKGERGPRIVYQVETNGQNAALRKIALSSAGEYREYHCPVSLDGRTADIDHFADGWSPADMVTIVLTGLVDDEHAVVALADAIRAVYAGKVRTLDVRTEVEPVAGIADHPAATAFLKLLTLQESADPALIERARKLGLAAVAGRMGGGA